jgi:AraC-like DNA-binding protein
MTLDIKTLSKESFVFLLDHIINDLPTNNIYFSTKMPITKSDTRLVVPKFSMDIVISGKKHMVFPTTNGNQDIFMEPGDIHCCPSLCWKLPIWDSPHEMAGIIFYNKFIRLTYINFDNSKKNYKFDNSKRNYAKVGAEVFFHTSIPLCDAGVHMVETLKELASKSDERTEIKNHILQALILLVLETLEKNELLQTNKAHRTWLHVSNYLKNNFYYSINRAHVAHEFDLNPTYLSRLFMINSGEGFTTALRRLRMEHAALLLKNTDMTIVEITEQCGYLSYSYFATAFKKYYNMTPGYFRTHDFS